MAKQALGGIDNRGRRLLGVGTPAAPDDGVPRKFIRYDIPFQCVGTKPTAGEVVGSFLVPADLTDGVILPANLAGSNGRALAAATASAAWTLSLVPAGSATETTLATLTFAANGTLASISTQAAVTLFPGDLIRLKAPASVDATLAEITFTVVASR